MEIDLNRLQIFKEVVGLGSFSKAALKLKQPKSRVSRHIAALEQELGVQLIYRTTRQFQLTPAGQELFRKATPLLQDLHQALEQIHVEAEEIRGVIRVTVPEDLGVEVFGQLSHEFMLLHPKIQLIVHVGNAFVDLVRESIDVAVRIGKVRDSTMIQRKIGHIHVSLIASPEFLKVHGHPHRLTDLEKLPFLAFAQDHQSGVLLRFSNGKENRSPKLEGRFACNNFFTLRAMALRGTGFTFVPSFLARDLVVSGRLVELFKDWEIEPTPITILIPHQKEVPLRVKKFVDFLAQRIAQVT